MQESNSESLILLTPQPVEKSKSARLEYFLPNYEIIIINVQFSIPSKLGRVCSFFPNLLLNL
jgi:hypothetical protein